MLQFLQPDVALHSFPYISAMLQLKCYMLFWDRGAVGERGALGSRGLERVGERRKGGFRFLFCSARVACVVPCGGRDEVPCGAGVLFRARGGTLGRTRSASGRALEAGRPGARYVVCNNSSIGFNNFFFLNKTNARDKSELPRELKGDSEVSFTKRSFFALSFFLFGEMMLGRELNLRILVEQFNFRWAYLSSLSFFA